MELLQDKITEFQHFYSWAHSISDGRVKDWPLMEGYTPTLVLTGLYLVAVYVGPILMKGREPFKLKWSLVIYNFALVIMNFHISSELFYNSLRLGYSYRCQLVNYTYDPREMRIAKALWWFYFSKLVEMLDTIFFILRKKDNQVSFLHVYHHATMFPIWYIGVKWVAGGQSFFGAMINSFVHVLMYTYYGVAAFGPEYQKYLWWKRYLTKIQLVQFVVGIVHAVQSLATGCKFPRWMHWALIIYAFTILLFFINFYYHAYVKAQHQKAAKQAASTSGNEANGYLKNGDVKATNQLKTKKRK